MFRPVASKQNQSTREQNRGAMETGPLGLSTYRPHGKQVEQTGLWLEKDRTPAANGTKEHATQYGDCSCFVVWEELTWLMLHARKWSSAALACRQRIARLGFGKEK